MGPGFRVRARQVDVRGISAAPMHVHVHLSDHLVNVGFRTLRHLDVRLPSGPSFGTTGLRILVDGSAVRALPVTPQPGSALRVRFDPPWPQQKARTITFDYDFQTQGVGRNGVAATDSGFYLAAPNALPRWLAPPGVFAVADTQGREEELEVTAPSDFRVLAAGRLQRRKRRGRSILYRYRVGSARGPAFVIAGRYLQRSVMTPQRAVIFWTLTPLDAGAAQAAAARLATSFAAYEAVFGPAGDKSTPLRIVETAADLAPPEGGEPGVSGASFPYGVLLDRNSFGKIATEPVLERAEYELARTWLGWRAQIRPESELLVGRGLGLFAVALAAEARGGAVARRRDVARLLAGYDRARARAKDRPLIASPDSYTAGERAVEMYKGALFCADLEDRVGPEKFRSGVRRMMQAMQGRQISWEELRATLEFATGRDFADEFRRWLNHPGIPKAFRARYAPAE